MSNKALKKAYTTLYDHGHVGLFLLTNQREFYVRRNETLEKGICVVGQTGVLSF